MRTQGLLRGGAALPECDRHRRPRGAGVPQSRRRARRRGQGQGSGDASGRNWWTWHPIAPTWRSIGSRRSRSATGNPERFTRLCRRLIERQPAGLARAAGAVTPLRGQRPDPGGARPAVRRADAESARARASTRRSGGRSASCAIRADLVNRYGELTQHAVFYLDPHVCMRCRYRSTELLWQCPHCHDWNTFVEERIAPAQDATEVEV